MHRICTSVGRLRSVPILPERASVAGWHLRSFGRENELGLCGWIWCFFLRLREVSELHTPLRFQTPDRQSSDASKCLKKNAESNLGLHSTWLSQTTPPHTKVSTPIAKSSARPPTVCSADSAAKSGHTTPPVHNSITHTQSQVHTIIIPSCPPGYVVAITKHSAGPVP